MTQKLIDGIIIIGDKMAKVGRPKFIIDYDTVEKLAHIQCTYGEIASFLGCSVDKLKKDEEFILRYKKGAEGGRMSLRRYQFKLAEKNVAMAIWLGKQYLGQRDNIDVSNTNEISKLDELLAEVKKNAIK